VGRESHAHSDISAARYLSRVNASFAFVGSAVWDAAKGVSGSSVAKQAIKRALIQQAQTPVFLADSTKYGLCNPWEIARLNEFSFIVTDDGLSEKDMRAVSAAGGHLRVAGREPSSRMMLVSSKQET
jgi:DeoR/GlpR family transcriptional regulator of sugar metabolism